MSLSSTRTALLAGAAALSLGLTAARAQRAPELPQPALPLADPSEMIDNKRVEARLQREERALRELRQIVLQAKAQGNPVTVKDTGPDPQVETLTARVADLEETLRRQTGQTEENNHNAQLVARAAADANAALAARVETLERQLQAAGAAALAGAAPAPTEPAAGPSAQQSSGEGPGVLGTIRGRGRGPNGDIQADPGLLGDRRPSADGTPAGPGDEQQTYKAARQTLDSGDYVGGAQALQDYLQRYPTSPRAGEANYWLGRTLAVRNMHAEAAAAYARALKGWPQSAWAGDAVLRLSTSLVELKRGSDACKAVAEFDARYAAKAAPATRTRAKDIRARAACA